jgi:hypothetical protein
MNTRSFAFKLLLASLASGCLASAQQSTKPPKQPDNGPSLEVTLKFIKDKIGGEGKLAYTASVTDTAQQGVEWTNKFEVELSDPTYSVEACQVSYHWHAEQNGKVADDKDYTLNLREVQNMVVLPQEENQHQVDTRNGQASWQSRITPPLFALVVKRSKHVENLFLFSEEEMAHRVAKAMVHAVELCGGGSDEPF